MKILWAIEVALISDIAILFLIKVYKDAKAVRRWKNGQTDKGSDN